MTFYFPILSLHNLSAPLTIFQLIVVVRWFWSVRMGSSGRPSTSPLVVTSWPSSPVWKLASYRGVSLSPPSGPRKARCVILLELYSHLHIRLQLNKLQK